MNGFKYSFWALSIGWIDFGAMAQPSITHALPAHKADAKGLQIAGFSLTIAVIGWRFGWSMYEVLVRLSGSAIGRTAPDGRASTAVRA